MPTNELYLGKYYLYIMRTMLNIVCVGRLLQVIQIVTIVLLHRVKIVTCKSDYFTKAERSPITDLSLSSLCYFTTYSQFYGPLGMLKYTTNFSCKHFSEEKKK